LPHGRGEVVLIVDDDSGILLVTERILSSHGYEVLSASDGLQALQTFRKQRERITAVICDQMMPGLTGSQVLAQIHQEAPHIGLLVMSGLGEDLRRSAPELANDVTILSKPIKLAALLTGLRQALANTGTPESCS